MIDLLARQIHHPVNFDLVKGETAQDLYDFGKAIHGGTCHIAVIWGLEYGWLRRRFPQIEPMLVTMQPEQAFRSQIMVRQGFAADDFSDLKGTRLGTYRRMPLMDRFFLRRLTQQQGQTLDAFFGQVKEYPTAEAAVLALHNKQADSIALNIPVYSRHIANRPKLQMRSVAVSGPFPEPVLVGRPDLVNALRPGLWAEARGKLEQIHQTAEGRQCLDFWREEQFVRPSETAFERMLRERLDEYPITMLQQSAPTDQP